MLYNHAIYGFYASPVLHAQALSQAVWIIQRLVTVPAPQTVATHQVALAAVRQALAAACLAESPPLTEVIRLEITDPFDKATLYYVRTTDYAPYRP